MKVFKYIKVAIRSLFKYRSDAIINVIGLSIGIMISIIALMYVRYELNFDKTFSKSNQTYRVITHGIVGPNTFQSALSPMPLSKYLQKNFSEIDVATKLLRGANKLISYKEKKFNEDNFFYADSSFFQIFDVPFILGDPHQALNDENHVVITKPIANKYFGFENPLGKKIKLDNGLVLEISGVCLPMETNSHFHFDFVASQQAINQLYSGKTHKEIDEYKNNWIKIDWYTYLVLNKSASPQQLTAKIQSALQEKIEQQIKSINKDSLEVVNGIKEISFELQPLGDIHLHSKLDNELETNSKRIYVVLFSFIAVFVLIITSINFINLTTAKVSYRLNEIGVRKLVGVSRKELFIQFIAEAVTYSFVALFIGLVSVELLLPGFNNLFGLHLKFNSLESRFDLSYIIFITFVVGVISGIYPAISLSGFKEFIIFKNGFQLGKKGLILRGLLTSVQILVATFLVILALGMYWQISYLRNKNLGFDRRNVVVVERGYSLGVRFKEFKKELKSIANIEDVSACSVLPGEKATQISLNYSGKDGDKVILLPVNFVERDFFRTLNINFQAGELWSETNEKMASDVVINEQAKIYLNMSKPLGQSLSVPNSTKDKHWGFSIRGVVKDFNLEPLQFPLRPLVLMDLPIGSFYDNLLIKISDKSDTKKTINIINNIWNKYTNNEPFEYKMLSKNLENNLQEEKKVLKIVLVFMILSSFVAWLGLRAYATYVRELKREEFQIKKINGASPNQIFSELFLNISQFVLIGIILAIPISYVIIQLWLKGFAYYNRLPVTIMIATGAIIWGMSFLLVLLYSFKDIKNSQIS